MTLDGFKSKYLGKQVEYHSFGGSETYNQCVDLANQYIKEVLGLTPIIGTNAKDFPKKYDSTEFEWIPNTPKGVPKPGDIIVWNGRVGGGAGHVAVVLNANVNNFTSLDQNWSQKQKVTTEEHNYKNVSGWLHPKESMSNNIEIPKSTFEELVSKATKLDQIRTTIGTDSATQIKQDYDNYKKDLENKNNDLKTERDRAELARKELNTLVAACAKALNTVQEPNQIISKLSTLEADLDRLDDIERQFAELQLASGKEKEELLAEVERLKALVAHGDLTKYSLEEILSEIVRRLKNIIRRSS
jgi:hypothetical protein